MDGSGNTAAMFEPIKRKLRIIKGAQFSRGWIWKPGGVPMDFAGCSARMQVRAEKDAADVLLELTTENGGIVLGAEPGAIDLWIGAVQTAAITWEAGVFDLEIQYAAGPDHVDRFFEGSITASAEVTR